LQSFPTAVSAASMRSCHRACEVLLPLRRRT